MGDVVKQPSSEMSQVSHWHKIRSLTQLIVTTEEWRIWKPVILFNNSNIHLNGPNHNPTPGIFSTLPIAGHCLNIKGGRYVVCVFAVLEIDQIGNEMYVLWQTVSTE